MCPICSIRKNVKPRGKRKRERRKEGREMRKKEEIRCKRIEERLCGEGERRKEDKTSKTNMNSRLTK